MTIVVAPPPADPGLAAAQLAAAEAWAAADADLAAARKAESDLRAAAVAAVFAAGLEVGTTHQQLAGGQVLTAVVRTTAKVDAGKIEAALQRLRKLGEAGELLASRLIRWRPDCSLSEWKQLTDRQRRLFDGAIAIAASGPSLELKPAP